MPLSIPPVIVDAVADRVPPGPIDRNRRRRDAPAALSERGYKAEV
jgi:hypothetical protein